MQFSLQSLYTWYRNAIRNPKSRWWVVLATVVYFLSPIDFFPDFLPFIGEIDDIMLFTLLIAELSRLIFDYLQSRRNQPLASPDKAQTETVDVDSVSLE
jgi:uncharacterized membrane protein YkvA (DUF1232 family)